MSTKRVLSGVLLILMLVGMVAGMLTGCQQADSSRFRSLEDFKHAKIGLITGTSHDLTAKEHFPEATRIYFNNMSDMVLALEQGKIDGYLEDAPFLTPLLWEDLPLRQVDGAVVQMNNGFVFPQGKSTLLRQQVNEFFDVVKSDGTVDRLIEKWTGSSEPTDHPDYKSLTGENGTIRLAISVDNKPILYQYAERYTGLEMDLLTLFGRQYGYRFDIEVVPFESIIAGISAGKYDMGASSLNITPEREESVDFSIPYHTFDVVMISRNDEKAAQNTSEVIQSPEDLAGGTVAIMTGTIWEDVAKQQLPSTERMHFSGMTDMILALSQGKVDAILGDETFYINARWEKMPVTTLDETIGVVNCGMILDKDGYDATLLARLNEFIAESKSNGRIDALREKWLSDTEPSEHPDYQSLTGENGILKIAVENAARPMTYQKNDGFTGFDVELLTEFARHYGYRLEFSGMSFDALIPTVASGKCDIGVCGIAITEERAESVTFSDCYVQINGVIIVSEEASASADTGFWADIRESIKKTFIRENRWKMILEGIGVTMLISLCSAVAGSLLGFGLYMLSRSDVKVIRGVTRGFAKGYSRLIEGTPIVVILMILFYVIFGKIRNMSGIIVAILCFMLTFGAFVYDHLTVSVGSVDRGQIEAAYALGYSKNKTFFRIVLPQAMNIFLPSYCGQAVDLIKATAVVGYIAVNDLTKMGDIIRSNTYEAFFPLIATAVIYFLLTWALARLLRLVKRHFEPRHRRAETILKHVSVQERRA